MRSWRYEPGARFGTDLLRLAPAKVPFFRLSIISSIVTFLVQDPRCNVLSMAGAILQPSAAATTPALLDTDTLTLPHCTKRKAEQGARCSQEPLEQEGGIPAQSLSQRNSAQYTPNTYSP